MTASHCYFLTQLLHCSIQANLLRKAFRIVSLMKITATLMRFRLLILFVCLSNSTYAGEIALSFDDAPTGDSVSMSGTQRTQLLLKQLNSRKVPQVIFFCITKNLDATGLARLKAYARAGHLIGNHSNAHNSANKLNVSAYLNDVTVAHNLLKDLPGFTPLHRFPYLHYGADRASIQQLQNGLLKLGYHNGYVTVDNADWYLNHRYVQAVEQSAPFNKKSFAAFYVDTLWQAILFYDKIAVKTFGRSPKHVLLLHENDIAALFIGDLIDKIRSEGWTIISPAKAYREPLLAEVPNTRFHKQGRVAAIANARGHSAESLRHPRENTATLDTLLAELQ